MEKYIAFVHKTKDPCKAVPLRGSFSFTKCPATAFAACPAAAPGCGQALKAAQKKCRFALSSALGLAYLFRRLVFLYTGNPAPAQGKWWGCPPDTAAAPRQNK